MPALKSALSTSTMMSGSAFVAALSAFFVFSDTESLYYSALCPYSSVTIPLLLVDLEI